MIRKWLENFDRRWPSLRSRGAVPTTPAVIETVEQAIARFGVKEGKLIAVIDNGEHDVVLFWTPDGAVNETHLKTGDGNAFAQKLGLKLAVPMKPELVTKVTMTLNEEGQKRLTNLVASSGLQSEIAVLSEAMRLYEWAVKMRSEDGRVGATWGTLPASVVFVDAFEARDSNELK